MHRNGEGFSTLEVLASIVVMTVLFFASLSLSEFITKKQAESEMVADMILVRSGIINLLRNQDAWAQTLSNNTGSELSCLKNAPYDCSSSSAGGSLNLYDSNGSLVYAPSAANIGLNGKGEQCANFVTPGSAGNSSCPMRLLITWTPVCPVSGSCLRPQVQLVGTFQVNAPQIDTDLSAKLRFTLIK